MRILHVNKYLYRRGGAEGYMQDGAAPQRAAGDEVEFFGTEPSLDELRRLAEEVAPGRVRFLGRLPKEELHALMRESLALVMPSR